MARRLLFLVGGAILTIGTLLSLFLISSTKYGGPLSSLRSSSTTDNAALPPRRPSHFHLLITASEASNTLCQLLLSASILGYPSPAILGWDAPKTAVSTLDHVHDYLSHLGDGTADDLVLLIAEDAAWLQLRPQTLIDRYFDINRRANARLRKQFGWSADSHHIHQDVVFGVRDGCVTGEPNSPACYATIQSNSFEDVYGDRDDDLVPTKAEYNALHRHPQFMDPGVAMGTVRALTNIFAHARNMSGINELSTAHVLGRIHADQSLSRELIRGKLGSASSHLQNNIKGYSPDSETIMKHLKDVHARVGVDGNKEMQFGIGLDFGGAIAQYTNPEDKNVKFLVADADFQENAAPETESNVTKPAKLLPIDIANTLPPFWTPSVEQFPRWRRWSEIALLANTARGTIPAVIRTDREHPVDWSQAWFHRDSRSLLDASLYAPIVPVAVSSLDESRPTEYWPRELWKGGARQDQAPLGSGEGWLRLDAICEGHSEAMFGLGQGPWQLPEDH